MTAPEGLTALMLQVSQLTGDLAGLDHRQAGDIRDIQARIGALAALAGRLEQAVADHDAALASVADLDRQVTGLTARLAGLTAASQDRAGYQPAAAPRLWQPESEAHETTAARLRAWVREVYRPGYGHLAAGLGGCWDQHPLCLYVLDWLSELWSVLYLQPARTPAALAGQAEWHTRLLPAAAALLAAETRRCPHTATRHATPATAWGQP